MKRLIAVLTLVVLVAGPLAAPARAAVKVERQGTENPMVEVAKSTVWGGLTGLVLGGAIALVGNDNHNDGDILRWGFAGGTFLGFGVGMWWVTHRPEPTALLEFQGAAPSLHATLPSPGPDRGLELRLVAVRF